MSNEAVLGIRLFLMDSASSGLSSFGSTLLGMIITARLLNDAFGMSSGSIAQMEQALIKTTEAMLACNTSTAAGAAEYDALNAQAAILNAELDAQAAKSLIATAAMTGLVISAAGFVGFGAAIAYSVTQAAALEDSMALVKIAFSATDTQLALLRANIIDLADHSLFSTKEMADAFTMLAEHGYTVADVLGNKMGQAVVNLAQAIGDKAQPAAELLSNTMQQFSLDATQSSRVADILTNAFYHGIPDATMLQQELQAVAFQAHQARWSLQDTAIALDIMAQNGLKGTVAGTALKSMLFALTDPTNKVQQDLAALGVITLHTNDAFYKFRDQLATSGKNGLIASQAYDGTLKSLQQMYTAAQKIPGLHTDLSFYEWAIANKFLTDRLYDSTGKFKDFQGVIDTLGPALMAIKDPQQLQAMLDDLGGQRAVKGFQAFLTNTHQTDAQFAKLSTTFGQGGAAAKDSAVKTDTMNASMTMLGTTFASLGASSGTNLLTPFKNAAQALNSFIGPLVADPKMGPMIGQFLLLGLGVSGAGVAFNGATLLVLKFGPTLLKVGDALGGLLTALPQVIPLVLSAGGALWNMGMAGLQSALALARMVLNFILMIPQLAASAAGFVVNAIASFSLSGALSAAWGGIVRLIMGFPAMISGLWASAAGAYGAALGFLALNWPIVLLVAAIAGVIALFVILWIHCGSISGAFQSIARNLAPLIGFLRDSFMAALRDISRLFEHELMPQLRQLWTAVQPLLPPLKQVGFVILGIVGAIGLLLAAGLLGFINGLIAGITMFIHGLIMFITGLVKVITGVVNVIIGIFHVLHGIFTGNGKEIQAGFGQMWAGIVGIFKGGLLMIAGFFVGTFGTIIAYVWGFIQGVIKFFTSLWDKLVGHSIIPDMVMGILSWILHLGQMFLNYINMMIMMVLVRIIVFVLQFLKNIQNLRDQAVQHFQALPGQIMAALAGLGTMLLNAGLNAMKMLASGITGGISHVLGAVGDAANGIKHLLGFASPPKGGPLADSDTYMPNMMKMHASGILNNIPTLQAAVGRVASTLTLNPQAFSSPAVSAINSQVRPNTSPGQGGVQNVTVPVYLDSKCIGTAMMNVVTGQLQLNGMSRMNR